MSKGSGMGQKRLGERMGKGMDKCNGSHGKQCGRGKNVTKGSPYIDTSSLKTQKITKKISKSQTDEDNNTKNEEKL